MTSEPPRHDPLPPARSSRRARQVESALGALGARQPELSHLLAILQRAHATPGLLNTRLCAGLAPLDCVRSRFVTAKPLLS